MELALLVKAIIVMSFNNPVIFMIGEMCLKYGSRKHSGRAKVKGHTKAIPCLQPMALPTINFLHLMVSKM